MKNSLGQMVLALSGLLVAACSAGVETDEVEALGATQEPLLQNPGAFYTTAPEFGWCGAGGAVPISGDCHAGFSFNSAPGAVTFNRIGLGVYGVRFPGLSHGGNAQVVAQGSNAHCNVTQVAPLAGTEFVQIACRSPSGALVDSRFMVSYYRDTNVGGVLGGYALVRNTTPLSAIDTWNSTGLPVQTSLTGVGSYRVTFPGQVLGADTVQVTAVSGANVYCKVGNWSSGGGVAVDVRCFNFAGDPQNSDFSVSYGRNIRGEPRNALPTGTQGGFSVANAAGGVNLTFSKNTCPVGSNSSTLVPPPDQYQDRIAAIGASAAERPALGLVTALGAGPSYCNLQTVPIHQLGIPSIVTVRCFSPNGVMVNSQHTTMFELQDTKGC